MMIGYLSEYKLRKIFQDNPRITFLRKDDDHDRKSKGDLIITYRGHEFKIEVKSLQTNMIQNLGNGRFQGFVQCDASDRRRIKLPSGKTIETTCLLVGEFDILAVGLFGFQSRWDFGFALNRDLPRSAYRKYSPKVRQQLLKSLVPVSWPLEAPFVADPTLLFDRLIQERGRSKR